MQSGLYAHTVVPKARRKLRNLTILSEKYNSVCETHSFHAAFEILYFNAKRTSHSPGDSKREEGSTEICLISLKSVIECVRIHFFHTGFEVPHSNAKRTLHQLVIPKGKKEAQKFDNSV